MSFITSNWAGIAAIVVAVSQLIGKAIPDTASGFLGTVRKVAKVVGLYVQNNTGLFSQNTPS
jgi:hypothetical protein